MLILSLIVSLLIAILVGFTVYNLNLDKHQPSESEERKELIKELKEINSKLKEQLVDERTLVELLKQKKNLEDQLKSNK